MPYDMPKTNPADALGDIEDELETLGVKLSLRAHARLANKFYASLGKYLGLMGALNPERDIWHDSKLLALHDFVSRFVVNILAEQLRVASGGAEVPPELLADRLKGIMEDGVVTTECQRVIRFLESQLIHDREVTPICDTSSLVR